MLARLSNALAAASKAAAAVATAVLAALIAYVVFQRFVTHATPHWAEELPRLVLVWAAFVGGVACSHERAHLVAGMLPYIVRKRLAQAWIERINHVLVIACLAVLGYAGWELSQLTMGQTLTALDVPAGAVYLAVPVACALSAVVHLAQLFEPARPDAGERPTEKD